MAGEIYNGDEDLTLLERVLQLHGEFRGNLEPIGVTYQTVTGKFCGAGSRREKD